MVLAGRAFVNGELKETEVGITHGKIVYVGPSADRGGRRIDLGTSRIMIPGGVDPHVHFRDPGMTHKESFETGSMSAVCGGITCVLDMPNTKPPAADEYTVRDKKARLRGRSYCDYGLFGAVSHGRSPAKMAGMVAGFKLFLGSTTGNILVKDDSDIEAAFGEIRKTGKPVSVHSEDEKMISKEYEKDCADHNRNRPISAELNGIRRLAGYKGMKINICHCTTAESLALSSSLGFTTEVTMHHLMFDIGNVSGANFKVNPPLRNGKTREALVEAFRNGAATMIGSDHAPHAPDEKSLEFDSAPSGVPGVETTLPMMMDAVRTGKLSLEQTVRMCSTAPAGVFGMEKGSLEVGKDADLAIFDLRNHSEIKVPKLHSKAGYSPYAGFEAVFPDTVILRGEIQLEDGEFCGETMGADIIG